MQVRHHLASSLPGVVLSAIFFHSPAIAVCFFFGAVLVDVDHLFDYYGVSRRRGGIRDFMRWCTHHEWQILTLPLHSWEAIGLCAAAGLLFSHKALLALAAGWALHLGLDEASNRKDIGLNRAFYFLVFRACNGFRKERMLKDRPAATEGRGPVPRSIDTGRAPAPTSQDPIQAPDTGSP